MGVVVTGEQGIVRLTLDRPEALNAITPELLGRLRDGLEAAMDNRARALVLTGSTKAFCAGADLNLVRAALAGDTGSLATMVDTLHPLIARMREAPFPIIAAVEGPAVGAGMGLALAADLRVVGRSARLVPAYLRIGASPDGGVSYLLTRAVGAARATSLLLRNTTIGAAEMIALGLAEEVVDDGRALEAAEALAASLTGTPPLALLRTRRLIDSATRCSLVDQLALERQLVAELWDARDFKEGISAFLEKRAPEFVGE